MKSVGVRVCKIHRQAIREIHEIQSFLVCYSGLVHNGSIVASLDHTTKVTCYLSLHKQSRYVQNCDRDLMLSNKLDSNENFMYAEYSLSSRNDLEVCLEQGFCDSSGMSSKGE